MGMNPKIKGEKERRGEIFLWVLTLK